jgi:molybdenum cofactor biosynthesis protein B
MSYRDHQQDSSAIVARCGVITFSDTRTPETDAGGDLLARLVTEAGHSVVDRRIVREDPDDVGRVLRQLLDRPDVDAVITTGGTGVASRDVTIDAVENLFDRPLPGFGELFRMLSWEQVGSGAMLSRAAGGISAGKPVFCLPGSVAAVELGMTRLIIPELRHLIRQLGK